jgi:phospholipid/cholesterol/gamma-HCH transport system substrate-binding protein
VRRRGNRFGRFGWGLIGIVLTVALCYAVFTKLSILQSGFEIKAVFSTAASQIQAGSPVRIAGVNVGKVSSVTRGPGTTALATMDIDSNGLPIHADATMKIRPRLFLEGNFFIDVNPGSPSAPILHQGGLIPLSQTSTPVQADQVLDTFTADPRTGEQEIIQGLGTAFLKGGAKGLENTYKELAPASIPLAQATEATQGQRPDDLHDFIVKAGDIATVIAARSQNLGTLLSGFNQTMTAFANQQSALKSSFVELNRTLGIANPTLTALDRTLGPLRQFALALQPALRIAPHILDDATPLLDAAGRLLAPSVAPVLLRELTPALTSLDRLERTLPSLLNQVTPVGQCVQSKVVPVLDQPVDDGKLSTGQPVWQELVRYPVGLTSSGQNFGGNGYGVRYSFGLSEQLLGTTLGTPDNLISIGSTPLVGARPAYVPGQQPPMEPNVDCRTQPLTSLAATSIPATAPDHVFHVTPSDLAGWTVSKLQSAVSGALAGLTKKAAAK